MTSVTVNGYDFYETGCYVSGHLGIYAIGVMLQEADEALGTKYYPEYVAKGGEEYEFGPDMADEAEAALNEATEDGYQWGWYDGEFFLMPDGWWADEFGESYGA